MQPGSPPQPLERLPLGELHWDGHWEQQWGRRRERWRHWRQPGPGKPQRWPDIGLEQHRPWQHIEQPRPEQHQLHKDLAKQPDGVFIARVQAWRHDAQQWHDGAEHHTVEAAAAAIHRRAAIFGTIPGRGYAEELSVGCSVSTLFGKHSGQHTEPCCKPERSRRHCWDVGGWCSNKHPHYVCECPPRDSNGLRSAVSREG